MAERPIPVETRLKPVPPGLLREFRWWSGEVESPVDARSTYCCCGCWSIDSAGRLEPIPDWFWRTIGFVSIALESCVKEDTHYTGWERETTCRRSAVGRAGVLDGRGRAGLAHPAPQVSIVPSSSSDRTVELLTAIISIAI